MEDEPPGHLQGLRELRLRPGGHQVDDLAPQLHVHIAAQGGAQALLADVEVLLPAQEFQEPGGHQLLFLGFEVRHVQAHQLAYDEVADLHDGDLVVLPKGEIGQVAQLPVVFLQVGLAHLPFL